MLNMSFSTVIRLYDIVAGNKHPALKDRMNKPYFHQYYELQKANPVYHDLPSVRKWVVGDDIQLKRIGNE